MHEIKEQKLNPRSIKSRFITILFQMRKTKINGEIEAENDLIQSYEAVNVIANELRVPAVMTVVRRSRHCSLTEL